jgi:hypothetical protein
MKSPSIESNVTVTSHEGSKVKNSLRSGLFTTICWSAVLAGVAIAVSVQLILMMLGVASGVALANLAVGETLSYGALMWASVSMLIAAFVGAYVAGRMSGLRRKFDGVLHGVISWAVSILLALILATTTGGSLISGLVSNVIQGGIVIAPSGANVASMLNRQLGPNMESASLRVLQEYILSGRRDQAIDYLNSTMNVQRDRAAGIVDQALILSGSPQQASSEGRAAEARIIKNFHTASWISFVAMLLAVALSCLGGALGTLGSQRTIWNESAEDVEASSGTSQAVIGGI